MKYHSALCDYFTDVEVYSYKRLSYTVECWPDTTSAWASWGKFDIPVGRCDGVHILLQCAGLFYLSLG
jgi:hypothetical protein